MSIQCQYQFVQSRLHYSIISNGFLKLDQPVHSIKASRKDSIAWNGTHSDAREKMTARLC